MNSLPDVQQADFPRPGPGPVLSAAPVPARAARSPPVPGRAPVRGPDIAFSLPVLRGWSFWCSLSPGLGVLFVLKENAERSLPG